MQDAVGSQDPARLQEYVDAGVDIDAQDQRGATALHVAAAKGHTRWIVALLASDARVDVVDSAGATPLHRAIEAGRGAAVELLLSRGADVEHRNGDGAAALHLATLRSHAAIVHRLLKAGADIAAEDGNGRPRRFTTSTRRNCRKTSGGGEETSRRQGESQRAGQRL